MFLQVNQTDILVLGNQIESGYLQNPFHNRLHACDVLQTTHFLLTSGCFTQEAYLTELDAVSMYVSAAVHDFQHPGTNNVFQNRTWSPLALKYNDQSVLEMHHLSQVFLLINSNEQLNIFSSLSREERQ